MTTVNRQIRLVSRPVGYPRVSDFELDYSPMPTPATGGVLVRSIYLSLDPSMRRRMGGLVPERGRCALGEVLGGCAVGRVVESLSDDFLVGDTVTGMLGWQEYALMPGTGLRKLDPELDPMSIALGILGTPGLTAYFGLLDICDPQAGETVVVSGAGGGVGMVVGQIAKIRGCRVVGLMNSGAPSSWLLDDLGFDAAIGYGDTAELATSLDRLCPDGVDVYFDTVGGAATDVVFARIRKRARLAICGQSSLENLESPGLGPRWLHRLVAQQARVQGFAVSSYSDRFPEAYGLLGDWLREGRLQYREAVAVGLESAPQAFIAMLDGTNQGKQLVHLQ